MDGNQGVRPVVPPNNYTGGLSSARTLLLTYSDFTQERLLASDLFARFGLHGMAPLIAVILSLSAC